LFAVAAGIPNADQTKAILTRVDSGPYTHVRGTWCCEIPYSGDREDCYIVGGTVCGDSVVTMGRIAWVDSHARKRVGDVDTFINKLLVPLQQDLVADTWLYERYDENATQIRTAYYFEYPAVVSMMLREIKYGIDLGLYTVTVNPFPVVDTSFYYNFGNLEVYYSQSNVHLRVPPSDNKHETTIRLYHLKPDQQYSVNNVCGAANSKMHSLRGSENTEAVTVATSSTDGLLVFKVSTISANCAIDVQAI